MSGSVERFFEHLSARDWASLRRDLTTDVERVGPFGDRVSGRERYLAMLEEAVPADYGNDVHLVTYAADGLAAFARVTEHLGYPRGTLHLEEAYAFGLDGEGLVTRVEVFWQTPSGRRGEPVEAAGISPHDAMVERRYEEWDRDLTLVRRRPGPEHGRDRPAPPGGRGPTERTFVVRHRGGARHHRGRCPGPLRMAGR